MSEQLRKLLSELKSRLQDVYGTRLRGVYLFGSHARGVADEESDVDVLVVLDGVTRYSTEIERTSEAVANVSLKHGVSVSVVFASEDQWQQGDTLFFLNVRDEAIPA